MEPVTHILTGTVLSRTGLNRRAAYMTLAMLIAAEFPDIDMLWALGGPVRGFEHHRGITHTFVALPFEAALITGCFFLWHRLRNRPTRREGDRDRPPPNWLWLFAGCLVALGSHLLLDWTNNYGVRPFFPFNPHWYAGSFVFIFEPVMFAILVLALLIPPLAGLIGGEIGARKPVFRGRPSAIAACAAVAALYVFRYNERNRALEVTASNAPRDTTRSFASPHPGDPFRWSTVAETPDHYQLFTVDTRAGTVLPPEPADTLPRPADTPAIALARRTWLGRVYGDWSMFPVLRETPLTVDPRNPLTAVSFEDARFLYDTALEQGREHPPLAGTAILDMRAAPGERVQEITMDGREQHGRP